MSPARERNIAVEICADSVASAIAAERGGADRIELCEHLSIGGVTPAWNLLEKVRAETQLPVHVMIRPRGGDFVYNADEFARMQRDVVTARELGASAVVFGVLDGSRRVDIERTRILSGIADPLSFTFHRAFDESANLEQALDDVVRCGASRLLTSGGESRADNAIPRLRRLVEIAAGRITILVCGSVRHTNVARILDETNARECHANLANDEGTQHGIVSEQSVRLLCEAARGASR